MSSSIRQPTMEKLEWQRNHVNSRLHGDGDAEAHVKSSHG